MIGLAIALLGFNWAISLPKPFAASFSLLSLGLCGFTLLAKFASRYGKISDRLIRVMLIVLMVKILLIPTVFEYAIVNSDELTQYHAEAVLALSDAAFHPSTIYSKMLSFLYGVMGPYPQVGKLLNALFLSATAIALHMLSSRAFDPRTGQITFLLIHLTPQLAIWTTPLLRESMGILLSSMVLLCLTIALQRKASVTIPLILGILPAMIAYSLRHYIGVMLFAIYAVTAMIIACRVWKNHLQTLIAVGTAIGALILILNSSGMGIAVWEGKGTWIYRLTTLDTVRRGLMPTGVEIYEPDARIDTPRGVAAFLPKAYLFALFSPFPSHVSTTKVFLYYLISVLEYPLIILSLIGAYLSVRHYGMSGIPILAFTIAIITFYGLIDPVLGGIVRHRMQAWPGMMVLAAIAIQRYLNSKDVFEKAECLNRHNSPSRLDFHA